MMELIEWLKPYETAIRKLHSLQLSEMRSLSAELEEIRPMLTEALVPLRDGSLDRGDVEKFAKIMWDQFGSRYLQTEKQRVEHERQLAGLYTYLATASEQEWEHYSRFVAEVRAEVAAEMYLLLEQSGPPKSESTEAVTE